MPSQNNFELSPTIDVSDKGQNYTQRSEGYQADSSLGTLIGGAADILTMAVKGTDQYIKNTSTEQITEQVDAVRDEAIVQRKAAVNLNDPTVPAGLRQSAKELQKIDTARQQGKLRESSYWARMDMIARSMRSKYPGYREHIDNTISSLVGTTPANALVRALANEADSLTKAGGLSEAAKFAKTNYEYLPQEALESVGKPNEWSINQLMVTAAANRQKDAEVKRKQAGLNLIKAEREVSQEESADVFNADVNRAFVKTTSKFDAVLDNVTKEGEKLREANGGVLPPEFIQRSRAAIAATKSAFLQESMEATRNPAYASLNSAAKKKTIDDYVKSLDMISESLENGTFDLAAKGVKALKDNADNLVLSNDVVAMDAALFRNLGPELASRYLRSQLDTTRLSASQDLVRRQQLHKMASGETSVRDIIRASKNNRIPDPIVTDILRAGHDALKSKQIPKETWNNIFNTLYGKDGNPDAVLGSAKNNRDAVAIYQRWSSPATYEAVKAASAGDPSIMDRYNRWVMEGARTVHSRELADIRETTSQGGLVKIEWTAEGYVARPNMDAVKGKITTEDTVKAVAAAWNSGRLQGLNTVVKNLTPVWRAAGLDPKEQSLKLLGVTMEAQDTREDSGLRPFRELIKKPTDTMLRMESQAARQGMTREDLDGFLSAIKDLDVGKSDADKQNVDKIMEFLQDFKLNLPDRESTNVEDMRGSVGRFTEPRLLSDPQFPK